MDKANDINLKCPYFPACGGCIYLDYNDKNYQKTKLEKLIKQLDKLDFLINDIEFFSVGANSRRKIILHLDKNNNLGFFAKSSKNLIVIDACYIAEKPISELILPLQNFVKNFEQDLITKITITVFDSAIDIIFDCRRELNLAQTKKIIEFSQSFQINSSSRVEDKISPILMVKKNQIFYPNFKINLQSDIFIQATKAGLSKISGIIIDFIKEKFSKKIHIIDIYSGFGAYTFLCAEYAKEITAFEGSEKMINLIKINAAQNQLTHVKTEQRDLFLYPLSAKELEKIDLAIINPPRNGAGSQALKISRSKLKNLIYVSCNPQSFARDAKMLIDGGFKIVKLVAIDQFYMSDHLELVAIFQR